MEPKNDDMLDGPADKEPSNKPKNKLRYATVQNPHIDAILNERFRFAYLKQVQNKLAFLKSIFILSKNQLESPKQDVLILWIKGFEVNAEEDDKGFTGNYAAITHKTIGEDRLVLYATKVNAPLAKHPQKKRPKARHPNWGHPILRAVKKKRIYNEMEDAIAELDQLHEEFPETSIPLGKKINIMIYAKAEKGDKPVKKHILEIKPHGEDGELQGFYIDAYLKEDVRDKLPGAKKANEKMEVEGKFTAMVEARKKKKR